MLFCDIMMARIRARAKAIKIKGVSERLKNCLASIMWGNNFKFPEFQICIITLIYYNKKIDHNLKIDSTIFT